MDVFRRPLQRHIRRVTGEVLLMEPRRTRTPPSHYFTLVRRRKVRFAHTADRVFIGKTNTCELDEISDESGLKNHDFYCLFPF